MEQNTVMISTKSVQNCAIGGFSAASLKTVILMFMNAQIWKTISLAFWPARIICRCRCSWLLKFLKPTPIVH